MLLMILLILVSSFTALTGVILHSISRIMHECKNEMMTMGRASHERSYSGGKVARDNREGLYPIL